MLIWLIKDGEALPVQEGAAKLRVGMLAEALVEAGHQVIWWSSTFLHARKTLYASHDQTVPIRPGYQLKLLYAGSYRNNVSLGRILHHGRLGRRFWQESRRMPTPDVILCCLPTIELANLAVRFGLERQIPVIVDIRDPWPSTFLQVTPPWLHPLVRVVLPFFYAKARFALCRATRIVAVSRDFLQWGLTLAGRLEEPEHRVFYIGYAQDADAEVPAAMATSWWQEIQAGAGRIVFTFVGIFGSSYNLKLVIEAARELSRRGVDRVLFVLVGDGDQLPLLRELAAGLSNVVFTGWLGKPELHAVLRVSQVGMVLNANITAGIMPNKFFLYLANHLPVLTLLRGEMAELIEEERIGFCLGEESVTAFCLLIERIVLDASQLPAMRERAYRLFVERFEAERIYQRFAEYVGHVALSPAG